MSFTVIIPTALRNLTDNMQTIELQGNGESIEKLLDKLDERYPGFSARVCEENKKLRRFINIYVNGEDIRFLNHLSTPVPEGAEVSIVLAVAGG